MNSNRSCLIVGAGMAGLTAARFLQAGGWPIVLLDQSRGVGGRMATRRIGASCLDHGAQFFTVRDARFEEAVRQWEAAGWIAPWFTREGHIRYRAMDGMKVLAKHLAKPLDVRREAKVETIEPADEGWRVTTGSGQIFHASTLLLTPPAPQTAELLSTCADRLPPEFLFTLSCIEYDPCFSLLVTIAGSSGVPAPGYVRPENGPVEWIADNKQKGISAGIAALTVHANAEFSGRYLEAPKDRVARLMLEAAEPWFGGQVTAWQLHRWKYGRPVAANRPLYLLTHQPARLAIAGDSFGGPRLEGAFLSGLTAA